MLTELSRSANKIILATEDEARAITVNCPLPSLEMFDTLKKGNHKTIVKNDIYETASVEVELSCDVEVEPFSSYSRPYWKYVCESYEEYLNSEIQEDNPTANGKVIFEDDEYVILTLGKECLLEWVCAFKSPGIYSIRELSDIKVLSSLREKIYQLVSETSLKREDVCIYFDYTGKKSSLVVYISEISTTLHLLKCSGKFIYFDTLMMNLDINSEYYRKNIYYIKESTEVIKL